MCVLASVFVFGRKRRINKKKKGKKAWAEKNLNLAKVSVRKAEVWLGWSTIPNGASPSQACAFSWRDLRYAKCKNFLATYLYLCLLRKGAKKNHYITKRMFFYLHRWLIPTAGWWLIGLTRTPVSRAQPGFRMSPFVGTERKNWCVVEKHWL